MASDKQVTFDGNPPYRGNYGPKIKKVVINDQEILLATCGSTADGIRLENAIKQAVEAGDELLNIDDKQIKKATAIVYFANGVVHVYDGQAVPIPLKDEFFGVGTGATYAIGALHHGATLKEAVAIACLCDPYSGFGIQYEQFSNSKGNTGRKGNTGKGGKNV